jgi:hypothetical protein
MRRILVPGTGPLPHPATHVSILEWVAGWGRGPVPTLSNRHCARRPGVAFAQPARF